MTLNCWVQSPLCATTESQKNKTLMISPRSLWHMETRYSYETWGMRMCVYEVIGMANAFWAIGKLGCLPDSPVMEEEEEKKGRWRGEGCWEARSCFCVAVIWCITVTLQCESWVDTHKGILSHLWLCGTHLTSLIFSLSSHYACLPQGFLERRGYTTYRKVV